MRERRDWPVQALWELVQCPIQSTHPHRTKQYSSKRHKRMRRHAHYSLVPLALASESCNLACTQIHIHTLLQSQVLVVALFYCCVILNKAMTLHMRIHYINYTHRSLSVVLLSPSLLHSGQLWQATFILSLWFRVGDWLPKGQEKLPFTHIIIATQRLHSHATFDQILANKHKGNCLEQWFPTRGIQTLGVSWKDV